MFQKGFVGAILAVLALNLPSVKPGMIVTCERGYIKAGTPGAKEKNSKLPEAID
jgi:hypothetical protein